MKHRHSAVLCLTAGLFAAGVVAPAADAVPGGSKTERCTGFHAKGEGVDDGMGTTTATLYRGQKEFATTVGTFTLGAIDADGVASFTGTIVLTNDKGTLTAPVEGTLDTASGRFASASTSLSGTGGYADTTGRLRFRGVEDLVGLTFSEHVYGKFCVPKVKKDK